jgi:hypothetical protein
MSPEPGNESDDKDVSTKLSKAVPTGSRDVGLSPGRRKISRLRAISHQIRYANKLQRSAHKSTSIASSQKPMGII